MAGKGFGGFPHNLTPTQTLWASTLPPKNPQRKQIWLDLSTLQLKIFIPPAWVTVSGGGGSMTGPEIIAAILPYDGVGSGLDSELLAGQPASHYEGGGTAEEILAKLKTVDGTGSDLDANLLEGADLTSVRTANLLTGIVVRHRLDTFYRNIVTDEHRFPYIQIGTVIASPGGVAVTWDYAYSFIPVAVCDGSYRVQNITTTGCVLRHSTTDYVNFIVIGTFL